MRWSALLLGSGWCSVLEIKDKGKTVNTEKEKREEEEKHKVKLRTTLLLISLPILITKWSNIYT
jgi:hypothetical protein